MAARTVFLMLVLLGAAVCLQGVVFAEEAAGVKEGKPSSDEGRTSQALPQAEVDEAEFDGNDSEEGSGTGVAESEVDEQGLAHPLARILRGRGSMMCWSKKHCKKHFKKPGCCKKKCVNLDCDNKNCGKCGKCCKVKKGYHCRYGKCRKVKTRHHKHMCPKCVKGMTCCKPGKCVDLKSNKENCGRCGKECHHGSVCCGGKCVKVSHDSRHCGKCGSRCGYGKQCCNGCCKNVFGSDKHNCGACGKECYTKCHYGMCGYGR